MSQAVAFAGKQTTTAEVMHDQQVVPVGQFSQRTDRS